MTHPIRWYRRLEVSPRRLRWWTVQAVFWVFLVVATGALVRLTASGLGCAHWPNCTGNVGIPTKGGHALIEGGNRLIGAVAIVLSLVAWLLSLKAPASPRLARWLLFLGFLGAFVQIPLGEVTIKTNLNPWAVMSHFFVAVAVLTVETVALVLVRSSEVGRAPLRVPRMTVAVGALVPLLGIGVTVSGAITTGSGPHPGASGSKNVPRLPYFLDAVHIHAYITAALASFAILLVVALWTQAAALDLGGGARGARDVLGRMPAVLRSTLARTAIAAPGSDARVAQRLTEHAALAGVLLAAQMVVGYAQYHHRLPWWLVLVHVSLYAAFWIWSIALATALWRTPRRVERARTRVARSTVPDVD